MVASTFSRCHGSGPRPWDLVTTVVLSAVGHDLCPLPAPFFQRPFIPSVAELQPAKRTAGILCCRQGTAQGFHGQSGVVLNAGERGSHGDTWRYPGDLGDGLTNPQQGADAVLLVERQTRVPPARRWLPCARRLRCCCSSAESIPAHGRRPGGCAAGSRVRPRVGHRDGQRPWCR